VLEINWLAQGGEAIVYTITHTGTDEVVIKCPLIQDGVNQDSLYEDIMNETLMLKLCPLQSHICQVKEELIEYNAEKGLIVCYCVILEKATNSLSSLIKIWKDEERRA
jgi:hypothetical protein